MITADQAAAYRTRYLVALARRSSRATPPSPKPAPSAPIGDTVTVFLVDNIVATGRVESYTGVLEAQGTGRLVVRGAMGAVIYGEPRSFLRRPAARVAGRARLRAEAARLIKKAASLKKKARELK